jgi:O-antigen/teichoic acid export membrane protein
MCPITLIVSISYCLGALYYNPSGNRAQSARYVIVDAVVDLVLNLLLIPRWGAYGAVIATLVAESVTTWLYVRNCRGYLTARDLWDCSWKRLLAGAVMCLLVLAIGRISLPSDILKLVIQILSGAVFYAAALYIMNDGMLKEMLALAVKTLNKAARILNGNRN